MRILLTGCQGFIGKNISDTLMKHPDVVSVYGIEKDYMNHDGWEDALQKAVSLCDVVLHVGAISDTMLQDPNEMMKYNFEFSRVLFDLAETYGKKVVYSSSAANKGEGGQTPSNLYGWSKYIAEKYGEKSVSKFVGLRYFNVYGERSPVFGQYAPVIGIFLKQKNEGQPLTIVGDGSQRRDFIHVKDVAAANILAATADIPEEYYGQVFNIGSSDSISIQEIANLISDDQVYIPKREGEMETTFANIDKAKEILGWTPKINVSDWIRENL